MTLQNSQIQGRKVDSPKIFVNEGDGVDLQAKTSAQCNRKIKNKKVKQQKQVPTPANADKKLKTLKATKQSA